MWMDMLVLELSFPTMQTWGRRGVVNIKLSQKMKPFHVDCQQHEVLHWAYHWKESLDTECVSPYDDGRPSTSQYWELDFSNEVHMSQNNKCNRQ